MPDPVVELAEKGVALSPDDRSRLIDLLLVSLQEGLLAEIEAAWDDEVEQRLTAYDRGDVKALDGDEVLAEARRLAQ